MRPPPTIVAAIMLVVAVVVDVVVVVVVARCVFDDTNAVRLDTFGLAQLLPTAEATNDSPWIVARIATDTPSKSRCIS